MASASKQKRQQSNTEKINFLCGFHELPVIWFTEYHARIGFLNGNLDYYPQSGKATIVGTNRWFLIDDIEKFVEKHHSKGLPAK